MNPLRQVARWLLGQCLPDQLLVLKGRRPIRQCPAISLTFDDGPHPQHTPPLLEALRHHGATGTFFLVGNRICGNEDLLCQMVEEGHEIANHTWSHSDPRTTTANDLLNELDRTQQVLDLQASSGRRLMRPPKGELTAIKLWHLAKAGWTTVLWNVDTKDYRLASLPLARQWAEAYHPQHGDIVLMHDHLPYAAEIIACLGERGLFQTFQTVPVQHWLEPKSRWQADCLSGSRQVGTEACS